MHEESHLIIIIVYLLFEIIRFIWKKCIVFNRNNNNNDNDNNINNKNEKEIKELIEIYKNDLIKEQNRMDLLQLKDCNISIKWIYYKR